MKNCLILLTLFFAQTAYADSLVIGDQTVSVCPKKTAENIIDSYNSLYKNVENKNFLASLKIVNKHEEINFESLSDAEKQVFLLSIIEKHQYDLFKHYQSIAIYQSVALFDCQQKTKMLEELHNDEDKQKLGDLATVEDIQFYCDKLMNLIENFNKLQNNHIKYLEKNYANLLDKNELNYYKNTINGRFNQFKLGLTYQKIN